MTITDSIKSIIPSEAVRRVLIEGYARGALWAAVLTSASIIPIFLLSLSLTETYSFDEFARAVLATAISAAGGFLSLASESGLVTGETIYLDVGIRPTLITLLIGYLAYRTGGKIKEFRSSEASLKSISSLNAIGLGLGFVSVFVALSFFAKGPIAAFSGVSFETIGLKSILWMFFVVALPAWLGSMNYIGRKSTSSWKWAFASLRTFAALYGALLLVALTVFILNQWISPNFGNSTPELPATPAPDFEWSQLGPIAAALLGFLILLPAILFTVLSIGLGANFAVQLDFLGADLLSGISSFIPGFDLSSLTSLSVVSNLGPWPFVAVLVALALVALISGAKASGQFGSDRGYRREFLKVGVVTLLVGLVAKSVSEIDLFWTNLGKPAHQIENGELLLQEGFVSLGITTVSLTLIAVAIAVLLAAGATFAQLFIAESFPRLYSGSLSRPERESAGTVAQIFGAVTSIAVLAGILVPISAATIERVWAGTDGPAQLFGQVLNTIEGEDIQKTKELFGFKESEADSWLPDQVLTSALPSRDARQDIKVLNFNNNDWEVGNTDAKTTVSWKTEDGEVKLPLIAEAEVEQRLPLIKHPKFEASPASVEIRFATGPAMRKAGKDEVSVNGTPISNGTYKALPGIYELIVPGYKLIAPASKKFFTTGESLEFTSEEIIQLSPEQEAIMDKAFEDLAKECGDLDEVTRPVCFSFKKIYEYRTTESGFEADEYFALQSSNFEIVDSKCTESSSDEVKAVDVTYRTENCSATVKFDVEYFESKLEERPIFQTQRYNGCPEVAFAFCERFRQVRVGTAEVEVRGKSLGKAKLVSNIPYQLALFGVLDEEGKFTARDSWVAPVPKVEPKPEEPKDPETIKLLGRYETKQDMIDANPNPRLGDGYIVGSELILWVWNGSSWVEIGRR